MVLLPLVAELPKASPNKRALKEAAADASGLSSSARREVRIRAASYPDRSTLAPRAVALAGSGGAGRLLPAPRPLMLEVGTSPTRPSAPPPPPRAVRVV